ncbi:MAG: insulinase family protein, partial [Opitutales bacterium]|nr:insulinase family protein [Opitutales bacterium]
QYHVDLAINNTASLDAAMEWYRDICDGLQFTDDDLNQERGAVLSEKRDKKNVDERHTKFLFNRTLPDLRLTQRIPNIGKRRTIEQCTAEKLMRFHDHWYTPGRLFFVAVGDLDVDAIEQRIRDTFESLPATPSAPDPDWGTVHPKPPQFIHYSNRDIQQTSLSLSIFSPTRCLIYDKKTSLYCQTMNWALGVLAERLSNKRHDTGLFLGGSSQYAGNFFKSKFDCVEIDIECQLEHWEECLTILEQEFRRLKRHGVMEQELARQKRQSILAAQQNLNAAKTRFSAALAEQIADAHSIRWPVPSLQTKLELVQQQAQIITPEDCKKVIQELESNLVIELITNKQGPSLENELKAVWEKSQQTPVEAHDELAPPPFAYHKSEKSPLPPLHTETHLEDLDVMQLTLDNGVRVNLKNVGLKDDEVLVNVNVGQAYGTSAYQPQLDLSTSIYLDASLICGGLKKHSWRELHKIIEEQCVSIGLSASLTNLSFSGSSDTAHVPFLLELITAYLQEPALEERAWSDTQEQMKIAFDNRTGKPGAILRNAYTQWIAGNQNLFGLPDREVFFSKKREDALATATEIFKHAPIEVTVVGDIDTVSIKEQIQRTLGTLPKRDAPQEAEKIHLALPQQKDTKIFEFDNDESRSILAINFPTIDERDFAENRRLAIVADLLNNRIMDQVREKDGQIYGVQVQNRPTNFENYGRMEILMSIHPEAAEKLQSQVLQIIETFKASPVTAEELARVTRPIQTGIPRMLNSNGFWLTMLSDCQKFPRDIEALRTIETYLADITPEVVQKTAQKYLNNPVCAVIRRKAQSPEEASETVNPTLEPGPKSK